MASNQRFSGTIMPHKISIPLSLIIVSSLVIFWYMTPSRPPYAIELAGTRGEVVAFGDSLVYGYGTTSGNDFVSVLSKNLEVDIVNAGINGNTTAEALARLDHDVLSLKPKIVIVLLGGNDYLHLEDIDQTFINLEEITKRIQARGARVVLVGIRVGLFRDTYSAKFEELVEKTGAVYVPDILDGIFEGRELMFDLIHPNDKGHKIMAERIEPALRDLLGK